MKIERRVKENDNYNDELIFEIKYLNGVRNWKGKIYEEIIFRIWIYINEEIIEEYMILKIIY